MPKSNVLTRIYRRLFDAFGAQRWWPGETPLEIIVGAILTQNTAWSNVEKAIVSMKKAGALSTVSAIRAMDSRALAKLIRSAGYYTVKARRLKNCMVFFGDYLRGDLRKASAIDTMVLRKELLTVNGIGPETADSILLYAFGRPVFVVDAYTRRIFSRHGVLRGDEGYHEIQSLFTGSLGRPDARLYNEYHALIVRLGKEFCRPTPRCGGCPLEHFKVARAERQKCLNRDYRETIIDHETDKGVSHGDEKIEEGYIGKKGDEKISKKIGEKSCKRKEDHPREEAGC